MAMGKRRRQAKQVSMWVTTPPHQRSGGGCIAIDDASAADAACACCGCAGCRGGSAPVVATLLVLTQSLWELVTRRGQPVRHLSLIERRPLARSAVVLVGARETAFTTGCSSSGACHSRRGRGRETSPQQKTRAEGRHDDAPTEVHVETHRAGVPARGRLIAP